MKPETQFPEGPPSIPIPEEFFTGILPDIQTLAGLKIMLYAVWINQISEDPFPAIDLGHLRRTFFQGFEETFQTGLTEALAQGWLLQSGFEAEGKKKILLFLNNTHGKAAVEAISKGEFRLNNSGNEELNTRSSPHNIFKLYEENIGVITPIIADSLKDLETAYSRNWVQEAIQTAVKNNARSLRYIEVVLKNWQEEGKHVGTNQGRRRKTQTEYDPEGYTDGEFSDFIKS